MATLELREIDRKTPFYYVVRCIIFQMIIKQVSWELYDPGPSYRDDIIVKTHGNPLKKGQ